MEHAISILLFLFAGLLLLYAGLIAATKSADLIPRDYAAKKAVQYLILQAFGLQPTAESAVGD